MAHALLMPARATVVRRRCSSMSVGAGAARPRLADTYTSHRSLPRVLPHARARQRSSPRVLSKWLNGSNGRRRRWMRMQVLKVLNASNIEVIWRRTKHFSHRRRNSQFHKQLMFFQVATVMESIHCDDFRVEPGWLPGVAESSSAIESLDLLASSGAP
ncbi:uncharacterized protein LOC125509044 isoform X1 [Triticum urartu]|uniref:uncharacterized protein LOC125509044 isoform X1 n=1 Tax=Triticum urartu TaxID=4572 RepID=UPI002042BF39|nr:uncharacterized protein LOC125509044 isoform X1 [Triticum urartu]